MEIREAFQQVSNSSGCNPRGDTIPELHFICLQREYHRAVNLVSHERKLFTLCSRWDQICHNTVKNLSRFAFSSLAEAKETKK